MPSRGKRKSVFPEHDLSRRERQIMAVVYRLGRASVAEIVALMPEAPTADAVRRMAHILEEKGLLDHRQEGQRNIYFPTVKPERASQNALDHLMETFFAGSPHKLVAALLDTRRDQLDEDDMQRLARMIEAEIKREQQS